MKQTKKFTGISATPKTKERFDELMFSSGNKETQDSFLNKLMDLYLEFKKSKK